MDQRGGDDHTRNRAYILDSVKLMVIVPAIHQSMDVEASTYVQADELCQVVAEWMQEKTNNAYIAHEESRLVRKQNQAICQGCMTLGELGVMNNEVFYLF